MMCAFMTPVLKNDWEVYRTNRSRTTSESTPTNGAPNQRSRPPHVKKRGIGETGRSFSYHAPAHGRSDMMYVGSPPRAYHMSTKNSRYGSRASMEPSTMSPTKTPNGTKSPGPTKSPSSASLSKFHNKVMDKLKNVLHIKDNNGDEQEQQDSRGQS